MAQWDQLVQGFIGFNYSIYSSFQLVQVNLIKSSIGLKIQMDEGFHCGNGSIYSKLQLVQGFNLFIGSTGSIVSRVKLVKEFNWFNIQLG